ncbi:L-lactate dehydrogenase [Orussus abietinus]|uniref:L-lactate dehydrogenase n=1 Tax=Orussus abietinus TaxID=222816 RepID=UPI000626B77A|nr:L-lactate dehydrogenase [Orussus abietinus]
MAESRSPRSTRANTAAYLMTKPADFLEGGQRVKIVIVGSGCVGVSAAIAILFKRLASELVLLDANGDLAGAQAEDLGHAAGFLGNPAIVGTKDFSAAREAAVCVIACGRRPAADEDPRTLLDGNLAVLRTAIPSVCKFAPNSVLVIATTPVDILSYAAMKLSGFPPNRVIGVGTFLDSCRFQWFIAEKLGISASSVQAFVIGENGPTSVPVWSAVTVAGTKLRDVNGEIGSRSDPEAWGELHSRVVRSNDELTRRKGHCPWGIGICIGEIVDAVIRNTRVCLTVSTFVKGCRHGLEKDVFASLPCVVGRNGVQSYVRHLYTPEEQDLTTASCRAIYEAQKPIMDQLE